MTSEPISNKFSEPDRREFYRRKFRGKLEIEWGSATLDGTVRDIGPDGLFVELTPPLWIGATFRGRLILNPILQLDCRVRRVGPGIGIAVSFEVPEESGKAQLAALLVALPYL
jgi:hypothetical protein